MPGLTIYLDAGPCDWVQDNGKRCDAPAEDWTRNLGRYCPEHIEAADQG